jgi:biopolymer transport protein ExbD
MKIKRKKREQTQMSTALSDMAFILIIYFIVIAAFNINKGFLLNLPAKDSSRLLLKDDILRYELDNGGNFILNGKEISLQQAEKQLALAMARRPNLAVLLSVSPETPWQKVVNFVELAEKYRVDSFSFKIKNEDLNIANGDLKL